MPFEAMSSAAQDESYVVADWFQMSTRYPSLPQRLVQSEMVVFSIVGQYCRYQEREQISATALQE